VINESSSRFLGSHWVAVFSPNRSKIIYFDSYADEPNKFILEFLKKFKNIQSNKKILQNPFSSVCGQHCIFFIFMMSNNYSLIEIVKTLNKSYFPDLFVNFFVDKAINIF
jgi:hypothetical protein